MKISIDENGYVTGFHSCDSVFDDRNIDVDIPEGFFDNIRMSRCWRLIDGKLILDESKCELLEQESTKNYYRERRALECFPIINRGELWYKRLTDEQKKELDSWYKDWLDITETFQIPEMPEWI